MGWIIQHMAGELLRVECRSHFSSWRSFGIGLFPQNLRLCPCCPLPIINVAWGVRTHTTGSLTSDVQRLKGLSDSLQTEIRNRRAPNQDQSPYMHQRVFESSWWNNSSSQRCCWNRWINIYTFNHGLVICSISPFEYLNGSKIFGSAALNWN